MVRAKLPYGLDVSSRDKSIPVCVLFKLMTIKISQISNLEFLTVIDFTLITDRITSSNNSYKNLSFFKETERVTYYIV